MCSKPEASVFLGKIDFEFSLSKTTPDLIILDELHLLSGPLGSIAGLWEAALQSLMGSWRPKYIAATATIKGAEKEVKTMFGQATANFSASDGIYQKQFLLKGSHCWRF